MTTLTIAGYRLSPQQKYLWQLQENNINYLAKCTIKIQGKVKVNIFKSALEKILERHDNFRTIFQRRPGIKMPIQVILDNGKISWTHINLSNLKSDKQTEQIGEILQNQNGLIAQLDQQPIFPTAFVTLSEEEHILLISLPALIADSFTLNNLVKQISESYDLCLKESDFEEEAVQYLQFSEWQNELLEEEDAETEIAYWQNQQFQWVNLPFENYQFEAEKFTPEQYSLNLDANVIAKLEANILPNISIENFLLGCWQTLLWRLTKQSDITVKTVFSGRQYEDLEEVMGLLAKSLPISCQLEENLKFTQLLAEISDRFTEALERQEYFINSETEAPGIGFEFIDISKIYDQGDLSFSLETQSVIFDNFKIKLNCIKTQESIIAEFQYNSELINIDVIKSFAKQFEALVASAIENIDSTISQLNIFSESESKRLLDELNQTEKNYPQDKLIHQIFESQVELYPNNIAVVFEDQKLTYAELNSQANQLAHYLQKKGVEPETIVGIFIERSLEVIIAILGILKAGAAYLPIDTKLPEENLAFRLEDAGVNILLSQPEIAPKNLEPDIKIIDIFQKSGTGNGEQETEDTEDFTSTLTTNVMVTIGQQSQTNSTNDVTAENLADIKSGTGNGEQETESTEDFTSTSTTNFMVTIGQQSQTNSTNNVTAENLANIKSGTGNGEQETESTEDFTSTSTTNVMVTIGQQSQTNSTNNVTAENLADIKSGTGNGEQETEDTEDFTSTLTTNVMVTIGQQSQTNSTNNVTAENLANIKSGTGNGEQETENTEDFTSTLTTNFMVTIGQQLQTNPTNNVTAENLAYILYTSGSTGKPKGVAIEHRQILNYLHGIQEKLQFSSIATSAIVSTFAADLGNTVIFPTLCSGGCLHIISQECASDATALANYFQRHPIDYLKIVPSHLSALLISNPSPFLLPRQCLILGGEAATWDLIANIQQHSPQCRILNHYGPTETTVGALTYPVDNCNNYNAKTVPIGRPLANTQVYVLDEKLQPVPVGVPGELHIGGAGLARGYLNRPELTGEKFIIRKESGGRGEERSQKLEGKRLYKTGDLVRYLPDGNIEFLGRIDNQVKIRGFRIELGEIEAAIASHPEVQNAVVIVKGDDSSNKRLIAYLVPTKKQFYPNNLRQFLQEKLADYAIPSAFVKLEFLPLTPNGKIDKKALPEPDSIRRELENFVAPRNPTEELLANIWSQLLKVEKIGIHDNFFSVGGNSLLATQVISRLRIAFETEIPLKYLFDFPTVGEISKAIDEFKGEKLHLPPIEPISRNGDIPLSFAQQRLWFLNLLESESTAYHNYAALQLTGKLNISALEKTIEEIVRRHEILRTNFVMKNENPIQVINSPSSLNFPIIDLQSLPESEKLTAAQRKVIEEQTKVFDLSNGSLLRVSLLKLEAESHILSLVMHHIVTDGWSTGIFIRELSSLYRTFSEGKPSTLPELSVQYADFAYWQRQWLSQELRDANLNYWKQQLAGAPPLLELPSDRPRPAIQTFRGSIESFRVNSTITQKLKTLSQESGATLFMTLLSAFVVLLSRYSNQDDIVVGSPIANRDRSEIEPLIGFFINTLVLRTQLEGDPNFSDVLKQVRQVTLESYARQDVPFEQLVEALQPERSLSYSPLFQVMFILQNAPMDKLELPGLTLTPLNGDNVTAKFDLTLSMREIDTEIEGILEYNTDIFDATTIIRMGEHFQQLLEAVLANPEQPVTQIPLLTEAERHQLLVEWNDTAVEYPSDKCIHQLFEEQVEKNPDAVAVVFEQEQLTYQQLNAKANQLARYLQSLGVKPETLVGISIDRSLEMVIGLLGILKAGGAYVPIDPSYPPERLSYMLEDSALPVLLTSGSVMELLPEHSAQAICLDSNWDAIATQSIENIVSGVTPENLAYTIYTSGSTGKPKGVQICHHSVVNFLVSMNSYLRLTPEDTLSAITTISFDIAALELYLPLTLGAKLAVVSRQIATDGDRLLDYLEKSSTTVMQGTPATWEMLLASGLSKQNLGIKILCGGEALSIQLANQLKKSGIELWNLYGPTEATIWSAIYSVENDSKLAESGKVTTPIGRPIANTTIHILDKNDRPLPIGVAGELHIGGAGLARGYLNRSELTTEKFIPDPFNNNNNSKLYKTGDLARYLPDGNIEYLGRIDNQVKIRGFRIELGEIEVVLDRHPAIQQTVVTVQEYNPGDKRLVAYLVCHSQQPTTDELRSFVKEKLPDYMIPSAFVMLDAFPLTPNGKINRRALKPPKDLVSSENSFVPPSTPVEKKLAAIWSEVLGIEKVGIHDNFFEIGGHSLLVIQVQNRIKEISSTKLTVIDLFKNPTIATLAQIVELISTTEIPESQSIQPISRQLKLPLSFSQQRLWFIDQLEKNAAYNISLSTRLHGILKLDVLERAFVEIIRRHEVLRTSFQVVDGKAVQIISDNTDFSLSVIDSRELPQVEQEKQVRELGISEGQHIFDLSKDSLLRVTLIKLTEKEHILVFVIHHIIFDEWSFGIMIQELATLYDAFSRGKRSPLPDLSIQYADFAYWQREYLQGDLFTEQLAYWQQQLTGVPTMLALPTDKPRPQTQSFQGATTTFELPSELSKKIEKVSQSEGVTLFMMLLTGFQTLLYCYSQQQDFCIGSPIANRNRRETEGIIGFFVNTLVLRANSSGNPSFRELLQRVKETAIGAFGHQDLPFEKLLEELKIERSLSHNPLFQVWFVFNNVPISTLEMSGLSFTPLEVDNGFVRHDLRLSLWETTVGFSGSFQYKTGLFEAETINSMVKDLETIFTHIVGNVDMKLSEMSDIIQDSQKQKQILQEQELENKNRQKLKKMKRKSV